MAKTEAQKRADNKYNQSIKQISVKYKLDDAYYNVINDIATDKKTNLSKVIKSCVAYAIDNNIDISKYLI